LLWETILRKQISILAHARNSESQTKQSAPCLKRTCAKVMSNVRFTLIAACQMESKPTHRNCEIRYELLQIMVLQIMLPCQRPLIASYLIRRLQGKCSWL